MKIEDPPRMGAVATDSPSGRLRAASPRAVLLLRILGTFRGWATLDSIEGIAGILAARTAELADDDAGTPIPVGYSLWLAELVELGLVEEKDNRADVLLIGPEPGLYRLAEESRGLLRSAQSLPQPRKVSGAELTAAHDEWFRDEIDALGHRLRTRRASDAQQRLDIEFPEYLTALDRLIEVDPGRALRAVNRLGEFWVTHGQTRSGARLLRKALRALGEDDRGLSKSSAFEVVQGQSLLIHFQLRAEHLSNLPEYLRWLQARVDAAIADPKVQPREQFPIALHLVFAGMVAQEYDLAIRMAERCRDLAIEIGDDFHAANFTFYLARVSEQAGDTDAAVAHIERAIVHARRTGIESFLASCISHRTLLLREKLTASEVAAALGQVVEIHLRHRRVKDAAFISVPLALAQFDADQHAEALETLRRALSLSSRIRFFDGELACVALIAFSELSEESTRENLERCARLYGGVRPHLKRFRATIPTEYATMIDSAVDELSLALGSVHLDRVMAQAPATWPEVIAEADAFVADQLAILAEAEPAEDRRERPSPKEQIEAGTRELAGREGDVLALLLQGMSDKRIAERLALKPNTVRSYNSRIFRKFGVGSRSELLALHAATR